MQSQINSRRIQERREWDFSGHVRRKLQDNAWQRSSLQNKISRKRALRLPAAYSAPIWMLLAQHTRPVGGRGF